MELQDAFETFISLLLQILVAAILPVLVAEAVRLLRVGGAALRERLGEANARKVQAAVAIVVKAAEQAGLIGALVNEGSAKKTWAISEASRILKEWGVANVSESTLSTLIEAAIRDGVQEGGGLAIWPFPEVTEPEPAPEAG